MQQLHTEHRVDFERIGARHLSVNEAATYLGLSVAYLNRLRSSGGGPSFFKIGARVVYAPNDLDDWLAQHRRKSTSDTGQRG